MSADLYSSEEDCSYVIFADRFRFESVWFKCGFNEAPDLARGNENSWRNDYKFHLAEDGFNGGIENPVPLATFSSFDCYPSVSITDGMTRTIWLMANGAKYFPVFTYGKESAINLHRYIGVKNSRIYSNNDLYIYFDK